MGALDGKKVVIIGGSAGMGLATAELSVKEGAEVAIAARGVEGLERAAANLEAAGGRPVAIRSLSIEDRPQVAAFLAERAPFVHLARPVPGLAALAVP